MANGTEVLREYLLSLGFRINTTEQRRFDTSLEKTHKLAAGTGAALVGIATAAVAMVQTFAGQMERLYYASKRADTTVANLQAIGYAADQVGVGGDKMISVITGMARAVRLNPGLKGLLESLGIAVDGRQWSEITKDFIKLTKGMEFYKGARYAELFGIDPDTLLLLQQFIGEVEAAEKARKRINEQAGLDADKAAEAMREYMNLLRETGAYAETLQGALAIALLPTFTKANELTRDLLQNITELVVKTKSWTDFGDRVRWMLGFDKETKAPSVVDRSDVRGSGFLSDEAMGTLRRWGDAVRGYGHMGGAAYGKARRRPPGWGREARDVDYVGTYGDPEEQASPGLFARLEAQYGLPAGTLRAFMMAESQGNTNAVGPPTKYGTAKGPFQFIDSTAAEYGVQDPFNLEQAAPAAARKLSGLYKRYGNMEQTAAAWNWGEGNFAKVGNSLGSAPAETQGFAQRVTGGLTQHNEFHITGVGANDTAQAVGNRLEQLNAKLVQDLASATR